MRSCTVETYVPPTQPASKMASMPMPTLDLGRIDAGGGATALALGKLTVNSLGVEGPATQGNNNDSSFTASTVSNITGTAGTIDVTGNINGTIFAQDYHSKPGTGNIQQLNIGGSLDGNTSTGNGEVFFTGTLGTAVIGGGIEGGSSGFTGSIGGYDSLSGGFGTLSKIGSITVKGSVPDDLFRRVKQLAQNDLEI